MLLKAYLVLLALAFGPASAAAQAPPDLRPLLPLLVDWAAMREQLRALR